MFTSAWHIPLQWIMGASIGFSLSASVKPELQHLFIIFREAAEVVYRVSWSSWKSKPFFNMCKNKYMRKLHLKCMSAYPSKYTLFYGCHHLFNSSLPLWFTDIKEKSLFSTKYLLYNIENEMIVCNCKRYDIFCLCNRILALESIYKRGKIYIVRGGGVYGCIISLDLSRIHPAQYFLQLEFWNYRTSTRAFGLLF